MLSKEEYQQYLALRDALIRIKVKLEFALDMHPSAFGPSSPERRLQESLEEANRTLGYEEPAGL